MPRVHGSMACSVAAGLVIWAVSCPSQTAADPPGPAKPPTELRWSTDYAQAMETARREGKMLLVYFWTPAGDELCERFESLAVSDPAIAGRLSLAVTVKIPLDATIRVKGEEVVLVDHFAFAGLEGRPGVAIVDFVHRDAGRYGAVVSAFPMTKGTPYAVGQLALYLDRPPHRPVRNEDEPAEGSPERKEAPPAVTFEPGQLQWYTDYAEASGAARLQRRMLLIDFYHKSGCGACVEFAREALSDAAVVEKLRQFVKVRLPVDATVEMDGHVVPLLKQPAFAEMLGREGVAILDFADEGASYYGQVVSTFPFLKGRPYTAHQVALILDLPPATLTQRTLIFAVRNHPDHPASTDGQLDPYLSEEAMLSSRHQARIRRQGHHNWDYRFRRINAKLPAGLWACEVCAESWPSENLVEAAIECVRCWRLSSGHWSAVRSLHRVYGYDMRRGSNGVWYATGIFGRRS
jgi:hypothetical protein